MKELRMNFLAIAICVVLMQLIPMVWYGIIFNARWLELNHLTKEMVDSQANIGSAYASGIIMGIVAAYLIARLFILMRVESPMRGLIHGVSLGFAFTILPLMCVALFSQHAYGLAWIDGGHFTLDYAVTGLILGGWRKYKE